MAGCRAEVKKGAEEGKVLAERWGGRGEGEGSP